MTLDDYRDSGRNDLNSYFPGTVLPYKDKTGAQRMAFIEEYEDGNFKYRPNLKESDQWSTKTFKKGLSKFEYHHNLAGKMVQHQGSAVWVDTLGSRTRSKGIGNAHFKLIDPMGTRSFDMIQNVPSLIYPFLYQDSYPTVEEATALIREGEANSVAVSEDCAVIGNNHYSYMGVLVNTLEGLL